MPKIQATCQVELARPNKHLREYTVVITVYDHAGCMTDADVADKAAAAINDVLYHSAPHLDQGVVAKLKERG